MSQDESTLGQRKYSGIAAPILSAYAQEMN